MTEQPNPSKLDEIGKPFPDNDDEPRDPSQRVKPTWESGGNYYSQRPVSTASRANRGGDFSPLTWVMIVIAGIVLGFVIAMMFAGA